MSYKLLIIATRHAGDQSAIGGISTVVVDLDTPVLAQYAFDAVCLAHKTSEHANLQVVNLYMESDNG